MERFGTGWCKVARYRAECSGTIPSSRDLTDFSSVVAHIQRVATACVSQCSTRYYNRVGPNTHGLGWKDCKEETTLISISI
jgi:hypothetical protein